MQPQVVEQMGEAVYPNFPQAATAVEQACSNHPLLAAAQQEEGASRPILTFWVALVLEVCLV